MSYFRKIADRMANSKQDGSLKPAVVPDSIPQPMSMSAANTNPEEPDTPIYADKQQPPFPRRAILAADKENTLTQSKTNHENASVSGEKEIEKPEISTPGTPNKIDSMAATDNQTQAKPGAKPDNNLVPPDVAQDMPLQRDKPPALPLPTHSLKEKVRYVDSSPAADRQNDLSISAENGDLAKPHKDSSPGILVPNEASEKEQPASAELENFIPAQKEGQPNPVSQLRPAIQYGGGAKYSPAPPEQKKEETVVTINIGRIEVRTTATPSDPKPFTRKEYSPSLSLAEYLKKRSEEIKT